MLDAAQAIFVAYSASNALRVLSYIPQIARIASDRDGAKAISLATWWMWISANASTTLYAWVNLGDIPLAVLNGLNTLSCLLVVVLTAWKRFAASLPSDSSTRQICS